MSHALAANRRINLDFHANEKPSHASPMVLAPRAGGMFDRVQQVLLKKRLGPAPGSRVTSPGIRRAALPVSTA